MYTGKRVTHVVDWDVNTTPDGDETWEMESQKDISELVELYIEESNETDDPLSDIEIERLRDFATYLKNR